MEIDVGIITIREDEEAALLSRIDNEILPRERQIYSVAEIRANDGSIKRIATARCIEEGNARAQGLAEDMISELSPTSIIVLGIGGAFPAMEFSLGDVLLATRVHDLRISAVLEDRADEFDDRGYPVEKEVERVASALQRIDFGDWNSTASIGRCQPAIKLCRSNFYGENSWKNKTKATLVSRFGENGDLSVRPKIASAPVVSSDNLVKDPKLVELWLRGSRKAAACEMEMAGVMYAARRVDRTVPVFGVRGISDVVGFKREHGWTDYACNTAAAFALALVKTGYVAQKKT